MMTTGEGDMYHVQKVDFISLYVVIGDGPH